MKSRILQRCKIAIYKRLTKELGNCARHITVLLYRSVIPLYFTVSVTLAELIKIYWDFVIKGFVASGSIVC